MPLENNPFLSLYVTESVQPEEFEKLFSPLLMSDTLALFQTGNIVLEGGQGSGKSMLLALLRPEVRIAYYNAGEKFPVSRNLRKFISAGINLTKSGATEFGQRAIDEVTVTLLPLYFGDFLNYWIVADLLETLDYLRENAPNEVLKETDLNTQTERLNKFAEHLSSKPCWFGALEGCRTYKEIKYKTFERIQTYRKFFQFNIRDLPSSMSETKTSAGEPISQTIRALWETGVLGKETQLIVRIDQCEVLTQLYALSKTRKLHLDFREVLLKMMSMRDPAVSYRLGTRKYVFTDHKDIEVGTSTKLEEFRSFRTINLDEIVRRHENRRSWIFPSFAEDVFRRRLQNSGYDVGKKTDLLSYVLGGVKLPIKEKISLYVTKQRGDVVLDLEPSWPVSLKRFLTQIARQDPLQGKLGEIWVRQQMERKNPNLPSTRNHLWKNKKWWIKERVFVVSMQIAAKRAQRLIWGRRDDLINLSGSNILVFISLCQQIWASYLRSLNFKDTDWSDKKVPVISDVYIQSEGIQEASDIWYNKIREEPGGDSRQRLASILGLEFNKHLLSDKRLSYPGAYGFSLTMDSLDSNHEVAAILKDATSFDVLVQRKHTPKSKSRGQSRKWYLVPILAPHFQLPAAYTKEPMYVDIKTVEQWLRQAHVLRS
jgi:hypothetical protein